LRWDRLQYVAGTGGKDGAVFVTKDTLEPDVRFTQLLTQFIGSARSIRQLQETQTQLASFFSPQVMENLTSAGADQALVPSERDITVLFCDVRGFSQKSEQHQDNLLYLLDCVKEALGAMTQGILDFDGAIADFQGDAALGFWGWPVALEEGALPACLAALAIHRAFLNPENANENKNENDLLDGFSIGLGIAHGRAVAGQIGTRQQAKVGVFGPVVNQGARIEGLTRQFDVAICIDEATAEFARAGLSPSQARVRRLARIRPKGMDTPVNISELLAPADNSTVSDERIASYETALDQVIAGEWPDAIAELNRLSEEGPTSFLLSQMSRLGNQPPADWDGAFRLTSK
jgi:adenylate cyclase